MLRSLQDLVQHVWSLTLFPFLPVFLMGKKEFSKKTLIMVCMGEVFLSLDRGILLVLSSSITTIFPNKLHRNDCWRKLDSIDGNTKKYFIFYQHTLQVQLQTWWHFSRKVGRLQQPISYWKDSKGDLVSVAKNRCFVLSILSPNSGLEAPVWKDWRTLLKDNFLWLQEKLSVSLMS